MVHPFQTYLPSPSRPPAKAMIVMSLLIQHTPRCRLTIPIHSPVYLYCADKRVGAFAGTAEWATIRSSQLLQPVGHPRVRHLQDASGQPPAMQQVVHLPCFSAGLLRGDVDESLSHDVERDAKGVKHQRQIVQFA